MRSRVGRCMRLERTWPRFEERSEENGIEKAREPNWGSRLEDEMVNYGVWCHPRQGNRSLIAQDCNFERCGVPQVQYAQRLNHKKDENDTFLFLAPGGLACDSWQSWEWMIPVFELSIFGNVSYLLLVERILENMKNFLPMSNRIASQNGRGTFWQFLVKSACVRDRPLVFCNVWNGQNAGSYRREAVR